MAYDYDQFKNILFFKNFCLLLVGEKAYFIIIQ